MSVERFRPTVTNVQATAYCGAHPDGEYVKWSDYDSAQQRIAELERGEILTGKELLSAVITAVMSDKQADRDEACSKLQYHIIAVETERDAREAECESKSKMYEQQVEYSVKLQRLIEAFCRDDSELPYPQLHHHELLMRRRAALSPPKDVP